MRFRLNIQTKLLLGFVAILFVTTLLAGVSGHYWFENRVEQFLAENSMNPEIFRPREQNPFLDDMQTLFIFFIVIGGFVATFMSFIFARYLVKPMEKVIQATQEIAKGKYKERIKVAQSDEVGDLCVAVNEMAAKLEKTEQLRRELVSNVAHELATPLTNIGGYLRAMNDGTIVEKEPIKETLILLESETDRLSAMVDDVRALYLVDNPNKKLKLEPIDLDKLIHEVVLQMKPKYESKKLKIRIEIDKDLPNIDADRNKFIQILMNLLSNAVSYTPEGGQITVSANRRDQKAVLSILDTGIGISKEDMPFIFERFYRVDKSRSRKTGGTGVGLTIVKDLVESHGGHMELKSQLGRGSEFIWYFPMTMKS